MPQLEVRSKSCLSSRREPSASRLSQKTSDIRRDADGFFQNDKSDIRRDTGGSLLPLLASLPQVYGMLRKYDFGGQIEGYA